MAQVRRLWEVPVSDDAAASAEAIDFVVAAYREEDEWMVTAVPPDQGATLESLVRTLRRFPGESGVLGLVSVDEDFFVLVRVAGQRLRMVLSDVTAAEDWPIAREIAEELGIDTDELGDDPEPAGDLGLLADLGVDARHLGEICDDTDSFPDELLGDIAERLGFATAFREAADVAAG